MFQTFAATLRLQLPRGRVSGTEFAFPTFSSLSNEPLPGLYRIFN